MSSRRACASKSLRLTVQGGANPNANFEVLASCAADWRYRDILFTLSYVGQERLSDERMDESALHEVLHAAVHEMREWKLGDKIGA